MSVTEVRNVDEAVALVTRLKRDGKYDWFRGQRRNWPLRSSFARLKERDREEALQRMARFEHWVKTTPGLDPIASSVDMTIAVAQHYGLPTNFIDFTTEPGAAGFFASTDSGAGQGEGEHSCILCLNTHELERFWEGLPKRYPMPEFIRLSVPNLWRLEAQSGVFLFCPYDDIGCFYNLDRIVFPPSRLTAHLPEHGYYPGRKSALEVLLDQFFMNEKLIRGTRNLKPLMSHMSAHTLPSPSNRCDPDIILGGDLPVHGSWDSRRLKDWLNVGTERLTESATRGGLHVSLSAEASPNESGERLCLLLKDRLVHDKALRSKLVAFTYAFAPPAPPECKAEGVLMAAARLWDGLRRLPYTDEEIATGIGNCLALQLWGAKLPRTGNFDRIAQACFGEAVWLEFGTWDGSYSRAYAGQNALLRCVRPDIFSFLNPRFRKEVEGNIWGMLQGCSDPRKLFDFRLLATLFAAQIGPVQVLTRSSEAVFFSPARLNSFGLP